MDPVVVFPNVNAAALSPFDSPCALAFANLLLVASGIGMGATRDIPMGCITGGCHFRHRTNLVPYLALRRLGGVAIDRSRASFRLHAGRHVPVGTHDTYHGRDVPGQSGVVDWPDYFCRIYRRSGAAAAVPRIHLVSRRMRRRITANRQFLKIDDFLSRFVSFFHFALLAIAPIMGRCVWNCCRLIELQGPSNERFPGYRYF